MTPTSRHLQYARGYIGLGMVNEASDELEAVHWGDRLSPLQLRILALYVQSLSEQP